MKIGYARVSTRDQHLELQLGALHKAGCGSCVEYVDLMYDCGMVLEAVHCPACAQPEAIYGHGKTRDGRQRYRCPACRRTFQLRYRHHIHEPGTRQRITDLARNGSGVRDTARVLSISPQTVMGELKKMTP